MALEQRALGAAGIKVSCLGLGTVKFGRNEKVKYPRPFDLPTDRELDRLLRQAQELGVNLLDTAPAYGDSEERIGRLLDDRDRWVLCTKAGETFAGGRSEFRFTRKAVSLSVERSLRALKTDRLDVVLLHSDGRDAEILMNGESVEALRALKEQGRVRAIGMSVKTAEGAMRAAELMDVVMLEYGPGAPDAMEKALDHAARRGCGVLVKKALGSGRRAGTAGDARAALKFSLDRTGVGSVVVGTIDIDHLRDNAATAGLSGRRPSRPPP